MTPIGLRPHEDLSTPRLVKRRFETWERYARAEEAHEYYTEIVANRCRNGLTDRDIRDLNHWIDRVFRMSSGGAYGQGIHLAKRLTPREVFMADRTATLYSWHRADLGYTIATGVSQARDQSDYGFKLTQLTTSTRQPTYLATGINNRPAWEMDLDDFVEFDAGHAPLVFGGNDKPWSSWSVVQFVNKQANNYCYIWAAGSSTLTQPRITLLAWTATAWFAARRDDANVEVLASGGISTNNVPYFVETYFNGTAVDIWVNGTQIVTNAALNVGTATVNRSGIHGVPQSGLTVSTVTRRFGEQIFGTTVNNAVKELMRVYKKRHFQF